MSILRDVRELLKESDEVLKLVDHSFFCFCLCLAAAHAVSVTS